MSFQDFPEHKVFDLYRACLAFSENVTSFGPESSDLLVKMKRNLVKIVNSLKAGDHTDPLVIESEKLLIQSVALSSTCKPDLVTEIKLEHKENKQIPQFRKHETYSSIPQSKISSIVRGENQLILAQLDQDDFKIQAQLTDELAILSSHLKQSSLAMHETLVAQNKTMDEVSHAADDNFNELKQQMLQLTNQAKKDHYAWLSSTLIVIGVIAMFSITYIVIRLFPA